MYVIIIVKDEGLKNRLEVTNEAENIENNPFRVAKLYGKSRRRRRRRMISKVRKKDKRLSKEGQ